MRLGLNRDTDYRIWERHALQYQWCTFRAKRVTGADVLKANHCTDVPCFEFVDGVLLVRVHLEDARNTLLLAAARVDHIRACRQLTRVRAHEAQTANEWVSGNLKCQTCERLVWIGLTLDFHLFIIHRCTNNGLYIVRRGQVHHHRIQHGLNALVLKGRTTQKRRDFHADGGLADCRDDLFCCQAIWILEVLLHQGIILFSRCLNQQTTVLFNCVCQICWNRHLIPGHSLVLLIPYERLVGDQIDHTFKVVLCTDWNLQWNRTCAEHVLDHADNIEEVRT